VVGRETDDHIALVAPWPAGGLLGDLLARRGQLSVGETLTVLIPVASALAAAHSAGIRHGGVCPQDIWFDDFGRPLLGPLAVSRAVAAENGGLPARSRDVAPEVVRGEAVRGGPITVAADVFSLGSVALACLTGRSAWPADEAADVLVQSAAGLWPDPPDAAGPAELIALVRDMLDAAPNRRPSAATVAGRLSRLGGAEPLRFAERVAEFAGESEPSAPRHLSPVQEPPGPPEQTEQNTRTEDGVVGEGPGGTPDPEFTEAPGPFQPPPRLPATAAGPPAVRPLAEPHESRAVEGEADLEDQPPVVAGDRRRWSWVRGGRRSGLPSGESGPAPQLDESPASARATITRQLLAGRPAGHTDGGPGRLSPVARTGLILLSGVLVTLVALQVSVWWEGSDTDSTAVATGGAAPQYLADGAETDWVAVVQELDSARGRALAAADPALLSDVYGGATPASQADADTIRQLADQRLRVVDCVHQIVSVTVEEPPQGNGTPPDGTVRVAVVDTLPAHPIVDADGAQVGVSAARAEQRRILVLSRTAQGYRIIGVEPG
jgi:hypothetical protein